MTINNLHSNREWVAERVAESQSMISQYESFIEKHREYRKSIPPRLKLPKSVRTALDRIHSEAVIEKTWWETLLEGLE